MTTKMLAYTNCELSKAQVLKRVRAHRKADRIIFGQGWTGSKGCAVGCTLNEYDRSKYPAKIGVPVELAGLEDSIFEGLGNTDQKAMGLNWPSDFLSAINTGADLSMVWPQWAVWMLRGLPAAPLDKNPKCKAAVDGVLALYERWIKTGVKPTAQEFRAAYAAAADAAADADAAYAAAYAAAAAAAAAAYAAAAASRKSRAAFWRSARIELLRLLKAAPLAEKEGGGDEHAK